MRERPILFNGAMVRAILSGAKTQTRRSMKPQPADDISQATFPNPSAHGWRSSLRHPHGPTTAHFCSFGQPGDRLWVRETWMPGYYHEADHEDGPKVSVIHRADNAEATVAAPSYALAEQWEREFSEDGDEAPPWRPSIHMPRWACRLVLEITAVRVERLHELSESDAIAEGADENVLADIRLPRNHARAGLPMVYADCREVFADLWDTTGGDWDSNPWVWVIEFKRVEVAGG